MRTLEVDDVATDLIARLPDDAPLSWVRRGEGLVGWGEFARFEASGPDRFARASAWWRDTVATLRVRDEVGIPGTGPVAFGSFGFGDEATSVLVVPWVVVGRRGGRGWVTTAGDASALREASVPAAPSAVRYAEGGLSSVAWQSAVATAVGRIAAGDLDKVVLARDLLAMAAEPVDPRALLSRLATGYPNCWTFCVDGLVGATPELLVRLQQRLVTSRVLAGTIRRTGDDAKDLASAAGLARSSKDLEEHEYAVRSVAESLAPFCTGMNVPESPFVLHLPNVMHLASDVAGVLAGDATALDLAAALHPTAAVAGTPTAAAQELIAELENMDRGRYAGPVGWLDAQGDGEFGIALRCAEIDPVDARRVRLFAGCGIVAGSDPDAELAESQAKLIPVRDALGG